MDEMLTTDKPGSQSEIGNLSLEDDTPGVHELPPVESTIMPQTSSSTDIVCDATVQPQLLNSRTACTLKPFHPKRSAPFEFGTRYLKDGQDVWDYNAWDAVETTQEYRDYANIQLQKQREMPVEEFDKSRIMGNPARYWDIFYKNHQENFFKDRKWLQMEFPILTEITEANASPALLLEIGCGAGNTFFPIFKQNKNPGLRMHACDFSPRAVNIVKSAADFNPKYCSASVWDAANTEGAMPEGIEEGSVDIAIMVFIFSALSPTQWGQTISNIRRCLKPVTGLILFRDYGRLDLAQVRFRAGRLLDDNFYARGDGTRVYFFEEDELKKIWGGPIRDDGGGGLVIERIGVDRRLLVNRKQMLKMYRCWTQMFMRRPAEHEAVNDCQGSLISKDIGDSLSSPDSDVTHLSPAEVRFYMGEPKKRRGIPQLEVQEDTTAD